jgi:DNA-binding MarR family transcriptional regulator
MTSKFKMTNSFLDSSIGYTINMAGLLLKRELIASFKKNKYDVTPEQWAILSRLSETDGVNQNHLAQLTFKDNANITRIIDKLIAKKLVNKESDANDGRASRIFITRSGESLVNKLQPLAANVIKNATVGFSKSEVELTNKLVLKIIQNLQ